MLVLRQPKVEVPIRIQSHDRLAQETFQPTEKVIDLRQRCEPIKPHAERDGVSTVGTPLHASEGLGSIELLRELRNSQMRSVNIIVRPIAWWLVRRKTRNTLDVRQRRLVGV